MNSMPAKPIRLVIYSFPAHLPVVRVVIEKVCHTLGFDREATGNIVLSVDEALANVIKHAYQGTEGQPIEIEMVPVGAPSPEALRIQLRDYGQWVDPKEIRSRDLEDVRPGGLGVHIMKKCMDRVEYAPAEGGGTLLTMIKKLPALCEEQEVVK